MRDDLRTLHRPLCWVVVSLALLAVACGEEFEPYWSVDKYRILAIKADPPAMQPGDFATFSVLDYKPEGTDVTYEWSWCPVEPSARDRYDCPVGELADGSDAGMVADAGTSDAGTSDAGMGGGMSIPALDPSFFDLGSGDTAALPYPGTREQVFDLCKSIQEAVAEAEEQSGLSGLLPTTDCSRGYKINIRLKATPSDGEPIIARKQVLLWTGGEANSNPKQTGVEIRPTSEEVANRVRSTLDWVKPKGTPRAEQWYEMPAEEQTVLAAGAKYDIRATVDRSLIEEWRPPAPEGSDQERLPPEEEAIEFQWFVTNGQLDPSSRVYQEDFDNFQTASRTTWNFPIDDFEPCENGQGDCDVRVWTVLRDGRLGIDWAERAVKIVEKTDGGGQ